MRVLSASALGSLCTAALLLPPVVPAAASTVAEQDAAADVRTADVRTGDARTGADRRASLGSTRSLPLPPADVSDRARQNDQDVSQDSRDAGVGGARELAPRTVEPFSLLGVVWEDADRELGGQVRVRTRSVRTGEWSEWHDLTEHRGHAAERRRGAGPTRGATAPLWVGASDGVQLRAEDAAGNLPRGMRLELVRPGSDEPPAEGEPAGRRGGSDGTTLPALDRERTKAAAESRGSAGTYDPKGEHIAPRPAIVTREGWGADPNLREPGHAYTDAVRTAFVHHTAGSNGYDCSEAPRIIQAIHRYHVKSSGWRDIGYNFLVDKCGKIYEGRAGGVAKPVRGAHTLGFNENSMGVAVLGSYDKTEPSRQARDAVAELAAWKLGLYGVDPRGTSGMTGEDGARQRMDAISGHRDGFATECPGDLLYGRLDEVRATAARSQGR
ncbi:peptidoglycan recognition protein [Streptomyces oceani]|uniref:N-acetylmuramoyl-L-alanine amidase n=1 Tax=Streptomyces oceani TaxID=1075402 RepID=A0A1E7KNJ0_9ACTN|nr:peptidoglycan recognition protein [Streptomyces oceani]OEV05468.1 hypothetical protein AN216_03125 [Streptomyces oceani]